MLHQRVSKIKADFLSDSGLKDSFGHAQLGGVAPVLSSLISSKLKYQGSLGCIRLPSKIRYHISSKVDVDQAYSLGKSGIIYAKKRNN